MGTDVKKKEIINIIHIWKIFMNKFILIHFNSLFHLIILSILTHYLKRQLRSEVLRYTLVSLACLTSYNGGKVGPMRPDCSDFYYSSVIFSLIMASTHQKFTRPIRDRYRLRHLRTGLCTASAPPSQQRGQRLVSGG